MKIINLETFLYILVFLCLITVQCNQKDDFPVLPVKVSENGRYFVDQNDDPVFWLGTTQWQLFREYTLDEARLTIENISNKGFSFIQVMLLGVGDGTQANIYGEKPWINDNPLTPNEAYFLHVDSVILIACENNVNISLTLYHQRYRNYITLENAKTWAKWISTRYKDFTNIVWSTTPVASEEFIPVLRELAAGLNEGDGGAHIITSKPDPSPFSSSFMHQEEWLDFNSIQTWNSLHLIYPFVNNDYNLKPVKPVLMAEGAYEQGTEYGFDVTPLWIRRQAYYSYLAGGHHAYGHNDSWRVLPTWKKALDSPGAFQMGILKDIFLDLEEWWYLVPDQSIFVTGGNVSGVLLNLAARHNDGKWMLIYLADKSTFSIHINKVNTENQVNMWWIDPRNGDRFEIYGHDKEGEIFFTTPDEFEDAILLLKTANS